MHAAVRLGRWGGGNIAPFGYKIVGERAEAHLEVDDREVEIVRTAVGLVLDDGLSTLDVAKRLNALGMTPRSAPVWTSQNLRNCLRRGQWDGRWTFGKTSPKGTITEPIVVPVEAILDSDRAEALKRHLEATTLVRGRAGVHPLTGRIYCSCTEPMTGLARADRANRRYRCRHGRHEPGRPFCGYPSLKADAVDDAVWQQILNLLTKPNLLMTLAQERLDLLVSAEVVTSHALDDAERAVQRTQDALAKAAARCFAQDLDEATTTAVLDELRGQHLAAVQHRAMVAAASVDTSVAKARMVTAQSLAEIAQDRLADADRELRAKVFRLLDVRVRVVGHGKNVQLTVEGSVAHDMLLNEVREGVAPDVQASAGG